MASPKDVYRIDSDTTASSDDLHVPRVSRGQTKPDLSFSDIDSNDSDIDDRPRKRLKRAALERENHGRATRRVSKAKQALPGKEDGRYTKKAKAFECNGNPSARLRDTGETMVGRRNTTKAKSAKKERVRGDDSEEDLMGRTVPDYLKDRRKKFDMRADKLKAAGLKLPPSYDDIYFTDDEHLEGLEERPDFTAIKPCSPYKDIQLPYSLGLIPAPIAQWLRDYQVQGTAFLHELFVYQKGGILGDDMGLGKTVQVAAFLAAAYGKTGDERDDKRMRKMRRKGDGRWYPLTLIICPGSLIANWQSELKRWGWWHVDVYHGSAKDEALAAASAGRIEVLITTYATYRLNKSAINVVQWDCVVADECHTIKERQSEITKSMNEINALCRIGLTGTAIQNKYEELWTLLNWTNPGRLGPINTWKASISEPLKIGQSHNATIYELSRARKVARQLVENLLPQFFIRRMKSLIADQLPKKSDRVVFCPMTSSQIDAYENFIDSDIVQAIKNSSEPCDCGQEGQKRGWCCYQYVKAPNGETVKWHEYVFPAIQNLQRLSNHLALLIPQGSDKLEKQDKDLDVLQLCLPDDWKDLYRQRDSIVHYSDPSFCGKWRILQKLLKFWHGNGDKVLVFSHSVRLLKMLEMLFKHTSYNVSYLDGSMSLDDRAKTVDEFNSDENQFVFLISTRAGGVGLNITSANKVVIVDPNWNPSHDLQAQDRAYRIGQTRDVEVFRLISAGTIEEIVYARQIYKQQQANIGYNASSERRYFQGVQQRADMKGEIFGLQNLFELRQEGTVVLKDIMNKTNVAESKAGVAVACFDLHSDNKNAIDNSNETADEEGRANKHEEASEGAISQLAAEIASQGSRKAKSTNKNSNRDDNDNGLLPNLNTTSTVKNARHDPVQAILSAAGVQYTHENSEVIGTSKIEAHISKRAEEALAAQGSQYDVRTGDRRIFAADEDEAGPSRQDPSSSLSHRHNEKNISTNNDNDNDSAAEKKVNTINTIYKYKPPESVIRRQFCEMSRWAGCESAVEFGLVVEGWTQEQRRECLEKFYAWRKRKIAAAAAAMATGKVEGGDDNKITNANTNSKNNFKDKKDTENDSSGITDVKHGGDRSNSIIVLEPDSSTLPTRTDKSSTPQPNTHIYLSTSPPPLTQASITAAAATFNLSTTTTTTGIDERQKSTTKIFVLHSANDDDEGDVETSSGESNDDAL